MKREDCFRETRRCSVVRPLSLHRFTAQALTHTAAKRRTATLASMLPGQKFDESRLVKPGDWDKLAAAADDDDLLDFEARMESDFAALKAEVAAVTQWMRWRPPCACEKGLST